MEELAGTFLLGYLCLCGSLQPEATQCHNYEDKEEVSSLHDGRKLSKLLAPEGYWYKTQRRFGFSMLKLNWNWIQLSNIIFKYVNSSVWLILNKRIIEKWYLWIHKPYTNILFTVPLFKYCGWKLAYLSSLAFPPVRMGHSFSKMQTPIEKTGLSWIQTLTKSACATATNCQNIVPFSPFSFLFSCPSGIKIVI